MKYAKTLLALLLSLSLLIAPALAIQLEPGTGENFYVQDNANVLSADTEVTIVQYNQTLEAQCEDAQLVVVTVSYLSEDSDVAALQLMNDWGVGSKTQHNGMLLLLVANEYRGWLATGDGIDEDFTDDLADEYLNEYFWNYIDRNEFDQGVQTLAAELYNWYMEEYNTTDASTTKSAGAPDSQPYPYEYDWDPPRQNRGQFMNTISLLILLVIVWSIVTTNRYRRMRGWGYTGGFWPIFSFGGHRLYRDWHRRYPGPRPPRGPHGPGPGPGPGMGGPGHRPGGSPGYRPSASRGNGFGGRSSGGGAGRSGGFGGGAGRSSGFGGHGGRGGGGGGGRR